MLALNLLVTGGAGFIGSHVVDLFLSKGFSVKVLDNLHSGSISNLSRSLSRPNFSFVKGDVRDLDLVKALVRGQDYVVHLAALVSVDEVASNPLLAHDVNVTGTLNLLEASRRFDVKAFVYASSCAVYGEAERLPIREDHPLSPKSIYGASKLAGEAFVKAYMENYGLRTFSLRLFNVYGPRMKSGPYAGVIYTFIEKALLDQPLTIYGDGEQTRDFVYVEDVAQACLLALQRGKPGTYNIGSGSATSINKLAALVKELTGKANLDVNYANPRLGDIRFSCADVERARNDLSWSPRASLVEGLGRTITWLREARAK